jgi:hypothetical protein
VCMCCHGGKVHRDSLCRSISRYLSIKGTSHAPVIFPFFFGLLAFGSPFCSSVDATCDPGEGKVCVRVRFWVGVGVSGLCVCLCPFAWVSMRASESVSVSVTLSVFLCVCVSWCRSARQRVTGTRGVVPDILKYADHL